MPRLALATTLAALPLLLLAVIPSVARPQNPSGSGTQAALEPPASSAASAQPRKPEVSTPATSKPTLAQLSWLAGRWQGAWGPRVAQQVWTAPRAGLMMGTFQLAENNKTLVLEVFTVTDGVDGIKFSLRHFTPSLVAWEKSGPTVLNLASADTKSIVFENPVDGQPKRATLTRVDADTYISRSEVVPDKGDPQVTEITYHRQKESPPSKR